MSQDFDLRRAFRSMQEELRTKLDAAGIITQSTERGTHTELNWTAMLGGFLPNRYAVEKAFVADVDGKASDQIDLVVYDCQYSPLLFRYGGGVYVPAESVYAVFEIKPHLDKEYLEYAGNKVASVRELRRTSAPIWHAGGIFEPKSHAPILGGLLAAQSDWNPPFGGSCEKVVMGADEKHRVDWCCALRDGGFELIENDDGLRMESWAGEDALVHFALRLFHRLQQMGTVPAIDIEEWTRAAIG